MEQVERASLAILSIVVFTLISCSNGKVYSQKVLLGAYYFDGWQENSRHLTKALTDTFNDREPKWGWVTSSPQVMDQQITEAENAGLSFFSFCWYYNSPDKIATSNRIISYFTQSKTRKSLQFNLLVANHKGHEIGPGDWDAVCDEWIRLFKIPTYFSSNKKPLIIFFSLGSLLEKFGGTDNVKQALDILRQKAKNNGFAGVTIAICVGPTKGNLNQAEAAGFDITTGYNYHSGGFTLKGSQNIPIDSMQTAETRIWERILNLGTKPYIPVTTLNWDPRPWADANNKYRTAPYFTGFSQASVYNSTKNLISWVNRHSERITSPKIGLLYAWNEYGEGAYLTPTKGGKVNPLTGVKRALQN